MAIISKNSTIYIPTFGEKYTKEISVLVFYPGNEIRKKSGKIYMPPLIQKGVPDWFNKYVIVIPNTDVIKWDLVKAEYTAELTKVGLIQKDLSIGLYSEATGAKSDILAKLPIEKDPIKVLNLMLMDAVSIGNVISTVQKVKSYGAICYLTYNINNYSGYKNVLVKNYSDLVKAVGDNVVNTKSTTDDHEEMPTKFLVKWRDIIEKSLTTPTLIDSVIPTTISDGNKQSTENTTPVKTPETSSDSTRKTEVDANTGNGTKLKMTIGGFETDKAVVVSVRSPLSDFTVYIGDPIVSDPNSDEFTDLPELDSEYGEGSYSGSEEETVILPSGEVLSLFNNAELNRSDGDVADGSGAGVQIGGSLVVQPGGNVSNDSISLPADLAGVQNSSKIKNNLNQTIISPTGNKTTSAQLFTNMNEFVNDCLGPFSTFLKNKYPSLYKNWYITSATRTYTPSGGSSTSEHFKGKAIDSQILGSNASNPAENIKLLNAIFDWYQNNPVGYGQILFETRTLDGKNSCWIHWSYARESKPRMMFARFKNDNTLSAAANKTGSYLKPPISASALGF